MFCQILLLFPYSASSRKITLDSDFQELVLAAACTVCNRLRRDDVAKPDMQTYFQVATTSWLLSYRWTLLWSILLSSSTLHGVSVDHSRSSQLIVRRYSLSERSIGRSRPCIHLASTLHPPLGTMNREAYGPRDYETIAERSQAAEDRSRSRLLTTTCSDQAHCHSFRQLVAPDHMALKP